ncbi:transposase InsO family protein [Actinomadura luteofluorescens]|uniref:Transposase InsO family protein n=1 Tax=Actinomadura luteofluorescens TaxID=46163 RepID=A0A7Y9EPN7_9ACTN|nr:IS3 family transposase [Actinomadura luteofluorescens]NYD51628.1 transposase InsO family protein [Actinomadura luteofluorescens]
MCSPAASWAGRWPTACAPNWSSTPWKWRSGTAGLGPAWFITAIRGQYTALSFSRRCTPAGIRTSTGSVADCFDNAVTESFFATLETELLDRHHFTTRAQAKAACFDFIEGFYNPRRRHSTLGMLSPTEYERRQPQPPDYGAA